ncbi:hypothetical protein LUZ63_005151 [Rhynchospora breviuscula]|uniref:mRNA export factor GLE1 n=1 Tax=Rhynchospora breviuscula TaxID=2022672 RepID=A0A9Q0CMC4_9POAL|nr:hypothetical protein LUZ63_005151 [Rhynchospora breviuscula]
MHMGFSETTPPKMDSLHLDLNFPNKSPWVPSLDPEPNWDLDSLAKELNSLEMRHEASSYSTPIRGWNLPTGRRKDKRGTKKNMSHTAWYDSEESENTSEEEKENTVATPVSQNRFSCNDLSLSDSDEELSKELPKVDNVLLNKPSVEEHLLFNLNQGHLLEVQDARSTSKELDMNHTKGMKRLALRFSQIDKSVEARKDVDRRLEMEYKRNVADIVDRHISAIQWDHEQRSRIMERKLRDDASALEEAKRLERARIEEKLRKERAQKEAEARQKAAQEDAKKEAERKRAEELEAAKKREEEARTQVHGNQGSNEREQESQVTHQPQNLDRETNIHLPGVRVLAAPAALEAEVKRLKLRSEIPEMPLLTKELGKYDRRIAKCISKLLPTIDNVRSRAQELIAAMNDPQCPRPITFCMLANKVVSLCRDRNSKDKTFEGTAFACGYLILLVTSQYPDAMDYILAEFNKVCIYTVPKYLRPSDASAKSKEYYKMIGYHEEDGKLESTDAYLTYVSAYVKLYSAIIQAEIDGVNKPYGLKEGWRWIAMFLNHLPATSSTVVALEAFLKMAGFALYTRYGVQFKKILDVISGSFLPPLKQRGTKVKTDAITNLEYYITGQLYLKEPEGRHLASGLLSRDCTL